MNAGQLQSLKDLIEFLKQQNVGEFELEQEGLKVRVDFGGKGKSAVSAPDAGHIAALLAAAAPAPPAAASVPAPASAAAAGEDAGLHIVKSPIVGTFYESSAPGAEAFAKVGDRVEAGQILCIVEAMKLMNEIESDAAGEIVKRLVTNGQPVEYGQPLFAIRPR